MARARGFKGHRIAHFVAFQMNHADLWILPAVIVAAWFYFPYCQTGPNLCIWRALLHRDCPGCGLTRGVCFLVHGRIHQAIGFNRLSLVALFLMAVNFAKDTRRTYRELHLLFTSRPLPTSRSGIGARFGSTSTPSIVSTIRRSRCSSTRRCSQCAGTMMSSFERPTGLLKSQGASCVWLRRWQRKKSLQAKWPRKLMRRRNV
jgi:hypothetical protein